MAYKNEGLKILWDELGDIPFDEGEDGEMYIAEDWHIFTAGTSREDIWYWFDSMHSKGVASLMFSN